MSTAAPTSAIRSASLQMSERVMTGAQISDLMPSFPGIFSPLAAGITAAGERGGFLVASFERLANYSDRDYELQTMVKRETWYPKLVAFSAVILNPVAVVALVMSGPAAWFHLMWPVFIKIGLFAIAWYALVILQPFIPRDNPIKSAWDRVRLYMPIVGKVVRGLSTAKWCRAYGALYGAGVGPGEAMRIAGIACGNLAIGNDTVAQIGKVERGMQLTEALRATHHFPPLALQMVQIGEQSGDLDISLNKAADFLEKDAETTIKKSVPVIGILMLLFVAFFIVLPQLIEGYTGYANQLDNIGNPDAP
jgi:type II secretory pathway component PulF